MRWTIRTLIVAAAFAVGAVGCSDSDGTFGPGGVQIDDSRSDLDALDSLGSSGLPDETLTLETEDGSISVGGDQDLPDRLTLPVLDGGSTVSVFESDEEIAVVLSYPEADFDAVAAFYDGQMEGQSGFERSAFEIDSAEGVRIRNVTWLHESNQRSVNITSCPDFTGTFERVTCVSLIDS